MSEEKILESLKDEAAELAIKQGKAIVAVRKLLSCYGEGDLESWFLSNYVYWNTRGRHFKVKDVHVEVLDDETVIHIKLNNKKARHAEYLPFEILLILQTFDYVKVDILTSDEELARKAYYTFKVIEKFMAKEFNGNIETGKMEFNVKFKLPGWLKKDVRAIYKRIKEKAIRKGCKEILKVK